MGFLPWEMQFAFPRECQLRLESHYPTYSACWVFQCFHNPPNSDMDCRIFNMRTDVNASNYTRGCTDTVRESALKVDYGRKIPGCNAESNLPQWHNSLTLYPLSYIPILRAVSVSLKIVSTLFAGHTTTLGSNGAPSAVISHSTVATQQPSQSSNPTRIACLREGQQKADVSAAAEQRPRLCPQSTYATAVGCHHFRQQTNTAESLFFFFFGPREPQKTRPGSVCAWSPHLSLGLFRAVGVFSLPPDSSLLYCCFLTALSCTKL